MGFPLSKVSLDEWMSMTWVTCASGVEEAARLAATSSLVDGSYCLLLSGVKWLPWAVNTSEVQGLERGDPLCEFLRSCGIDGEEQFHVWNHGRTFFLSLNLMT